MRISVDTLTTPAGSTTRPVCGMVIATASSSPNIQRYSNYCMSIEFRGVEFPPLQDLTVSAPDGAIIGVIGEKGSGKSALLRLAAGVEQPVSGVVIAGDSRRFIRLGDPLNFSESKVLALDAALSCQDAVVKARACVSLERLRPTGCTILFATPDEPLLLQIADEIWWLRDGALAARGDPREVMTKYRAHVADRIAEWSKSLSDPLDVRARHGDRRARF